MTKNESSKPTYIVGSPESFGWMVVSRDKDKVVYETPKGRLRAFNANKKVLVTRTVMPDQVKNG